MEAGADKYKLLNEYYLKKQTKPRVVLFYL